VIRIGIVAVADSAAIAFEIMLLLLLLLGQDS
jgi:hypothetical protein